MIQNLRDHYIQQEILEYLIYPLPYINQISKNEIKTYSSRKINSLLYKKYNIQNKLMYPVYGYNDTGYQLFDFNVFEYNKNFVFIAFI